LEPQGQARLVGEQGGHLGERVPGNHDGDGWRRSASWTARFSSVMASIWRTRRAAFMAPSMATVATGMPRGIWTVAYRASMPFRAPPLSGTPTTGKVVLAATAPARWAAIPAPQMMAAYPSARARVANSATTAGV